MSIDGYGAGPQQSLANPLGIGGLAMQDWAFKTRAFHRVHGEEGGTTGVDDDFIARGFENIGAWIVGRNMFGPVRGPWLDENWKGWWGDTPPFHTPVFVLTHHPRNSLTMNGGTTFHFMLGDIGLVLAKAFEAAEGRDVRLGGGVATIQQYLTARLIDEMHLAYTPVLLGTGESLLSNLDLKALGYDVESFAMSSACMHVQIVKKSR
jgi:dihydrofolate reductase